jgi:catechol 2,3-dioxygenase-like lactoylglutathione lyase family enzyme
MIKSIIEICLYVDDLEETKAFYDEILGFEVIAFASSRHVFFRVGSQVLLCFLPEETMKDLLLPRHGVKGPQHVAFGVEQSAYEEYKVQLVTKGVHITHFQSWYDGGRESFYFEDPSGNVLEVIPDKLWEPLNK